METANVMMNGSEMQVQWTPAAVRALALRTSPIYIELELYFSCLVKMFVHFREDSRGKPTVPVGDKMLLYFRPVTSTACTFAVADRLGRQPETDIDSEALHHVAPKRVFIDYVKDQWRGSYKFL
jgi:hypothetical protein